MHEEISLLMHDVARAFPQDFGSLTVNASGPGISCTRTAFRADPASARGEDDRLTQSGASLGHRLFPLGEPDHDRFSLGADETGVVPLASGQRPLPIPRSRIDLLSLRRARTSVRASSTRSAYRPVRK
ncbi:SUKH-3 domain-containing protein [Kitasatospora sp. NPDC053057]|uniref:SUKH-3 domain-containing protein n=1 Tax=Kitasatospora sp. NPDC053057 TaxID=3364062 RepID=UPI0037C8EB7B